MVDGLFEFRVVYEGATLMEPAAFQLVGIVGF